MFVLDTNVVSELRKAAGGKADARVVAWVSSQDAASLYICALTLMELEIGILRVERRDGAQGKLLRRWMDERVQPEFLERTLPVDSAVALTCARLPVRPHPLGQGPKNVSAFVWSSMRSTFGEASMDSISGIGARPRSSTPEAPSQRRSRAAS